MVKVPASTLSAEALQGVIDDFILREGTDYGPTEYSLEAKRSAIRRQLESGAAEIWFEPVSETVTLRLREDL